MSTAKIRDFTSTDTRHVRKLVGQDLIRARARANSQVYWHPIVIWGWLLSSLLVIYLSDSTPNWADYKTYTKPLLGFVASLVPIGIFVEMIHRREFRDILQSKLDSRDLINIHQHYLEPTAPPSLEETGDKMPSGTGAVKVLQQDRSLRGVVCIERRHGERIGIIRHLVLDLGDDHSQRRQTAIELLGAALDQVFGFVSEGEGTGNTGKGDGSGAGARVPKVTTPERIAVLTDPFALEGERFYKELAFSPLVESEATRLGEPAVMGLLKMSGRWLVISRSKWSAKRRSLGR